jgi:hypothetical protein
MRAQHARSQKVYAPLLALACLLVSTTAVRAADAGAAAPEAAPPVTQPRKPARDAAAIFAQRLDLDAKQEVQVRRLLAMQQAQIRKLWSDPSVAGEDRVSAVKAINAKTIEQIRSLLTEEQKQKYIQPLPAGGPPTEPGRTVEDWLHALRPQNPDAGAPH